MEFRRIFMSKYYDYFEEQEHNSGEVTMDEFIAGAMQTDLKFNTHFSGGVAISAYVSSF